ncbi:hypothetical protein [Winogradskya humida]|uniref:hypothetical protein n=1 Tax=Winogradskya humida TaxID=113566 RepID=UPI0019431BC7|nr:hypothetical protein [Actinoplanes humidus]
MAALIFSAWMSPRSGGDSSTRRGSLAIWLVQLRMLMSRVICWICSGLGASPWICSGLGASPWTAITAMVSQP